VGGGPDISIQSGSRRNRIVEIPVHVAFVPRRARVLDALRD